MIPVVDPQALATPVQPAAPDAADPRRVLGRARSFEATSSRRAELTVLTADGDRVTLRAEAEASVTYRDALLRRVGDGARLEAGAMTLERSRSHGFGLEVEGELSREELRDLARLARKVEKVVTSFVRGDLEQAFARAGRLADRFDRLDSLAGFGLTVETMDRVVLAGRVGTSLEAPSGPAPAAGGFAGTGPGRDVQPAAAALLGGPERVEGEDGSDGDDDEGDRASDADSDGDDDDRAGTARPSAEGQPFGRLVERIRGDVDDVEARHPRLAAVMPRFLAQVLEGLDPGPRGPSLSDFLRQVQLAVLDRAGEGEEPPSPAQRTEPRSPR